MLPTNLVETRESTSNISLEGMHDHTVQILATNLKTADCVSLVLSCKKSVVSMLKPASQNGGLVMFVVYGSTGNNENKDHLFVVRMDKSGNFDLKSNWISDLEEVTYSVGQSDSGSSDKTYKIKIKVFDRTYVSGSENAQPGDYVVINTTLMCQFLIGEVDEKALQASATKLKEEISLQDKVDSLENKFNIVEKTLGNCEGNLISSQGQVEYLEKELGVIQETNRSLSVVLEGRVVYIDELNKKYDKRTTSLLKQQKITEDERKTVFTAYRYVKGTPFLRQQF